MASISLCRSVLVVDEPLRPPTIAAITSTSNAN
jgi:hypothetical protein